MGILSWFFGKKNQEVDNVGSERIDLSILPDQFIVFDLETTGLSPTKDEIIEIAAIKVNRDSNNHTTFQALIKPSKKIPKRITQITGITQRMLNANGKDIGVVLKEFLDFIGDLRLVAFNAPFDLGFLNEALKFHGTEIGNPVSCALKLARRAWPDLNSYKLSDLANMGGLPDNGHHRALKDCETTITVYTAAATALGSCKEVDNVNTNNISFNVDEPEFGELAKCKIGEYVNLWTPPDNPGKVFIYRRGSIGGTGKIGFVPKKYSYLISSHLTQSLPYKTEIIELIHNSCKIAYRLIPEEDLIPDEEIESAAKARRENLRAELIKPYNPKKPTELDIFVARNIEINEGDKLEIIFDDLDTYVQNQYEWRLQFVDRKGNTFLRQISKNKGKRLLKAHFNAYSFDVEVISVPEYHSSYSAVKILVKPFK